MTCVADVRRPGLHDGLAPLGQRLLTLWRLARTKRQEQRYFTQLDERALHDLGLQRGPANSHDPRDAVALWLGRTPG